MIKSGLPFSLGICIEGMLEFNKWLTVCIDIENKKHIIKNVVLINHEV